MNKNLEIPQHLSKGEIPAHIAVIMDGNGRWAKQRKMQRIFGHNNAIKAVKDCVEGCAELGVKYLTLYAFSTENWNRPQDEVQGLMDLLVKTISAEVPTLQKNNISLQTIGDTEGLLPKTKAKLKEAIEVTANNKSMTLILALNYSARWEICEATKKIAAAVKTNSVLIKNIDDQLISSKLTTANYPDPDLLIRTSGELRISNFLLWQIAYSELYFTPILWPDFRKTDLHEAIESYQLRERRYGKTGDQIEKSNDSN